MVASITGHWQRKDRYYSPSSPSSSHTVGWRRAERARLASKQLNRTQLLNVVDRIVTVLQPCYVQRRMYLCFLASEPQQERRTAVFAGQSGWQHS